MDQRRRRPEVARSTLLLVLAVVLFLELSDFANEKEIEKENESA
jgi:hypothetical protein